MENNLLTRQTIKDNSVELSTSKQINPDQMDLFADDGDNTMLKLMKKTNNSYIDILEEEREVLGGMVLSVNYLKDVRIVPELLGIGKISEIDIDKRNQSLVGICVKIERKISKKGKVYYHIHLADSYRLIKLTSYTDAYKTFTIGSLYMVNITVLHLYGSEYKIFLNKSLIINDGEFNKVFKNKIKLEDKLSHLKNKTDIAYEFIMYLGQMIDKATEVNSVNIVITRNDQRSKVLKVKFTEEIYNKLTNYFKLKVTY